MQKPASGEGRISLMLLALLLAAVAMILMAPGASGTGSSVGPVDLAAPLGPDSFGQSGGPIGIVGPLSSESESSGPLGAWGPLGPEDALAWERPANRVNTANGAPVGATQDQGLGQSVGSVQAFETVTNPFGSSGSSASAAGGHNCGVSIVASGGSFASANPARGGECATRIDADQAQTTGDTGAVDVSARSGDATGGNAWAGAGGDVIFMCGIGGDGGGSGAVGGSGPYSGAVTGNYSRGGSGDGGDGGNGFCIVGSFSASAGNGGNAEGGAAESGDASVARTSSGDSGDNADDD